MEGVYLFCLFFERIKNAYLQFTCEKYTDKILYYQRKENINLRHSNIMVRVRIVSPPPFGLPRFICWIAYIKKYK